MKYLFIIIALFSSTVYAQNLAQIKFDNNFGYYNEDLYSLLESECKLKNDFSNPTKVNFNFSNSKQSKIEGIETKHITKATIKVKINNYILSSDTTLSWSGSVGNNTSESPAKTLLIEALKDVSFKTSINKYLSATKLLLCASYSKVEKLSDSLVSTNNYVSALSMLQGIQADCKQSNIQNKINSIKTAFEKYSCDDVLYRTKVLIASGVELNITKATNLLLSVPPSGKCREEALKVIEELNSKTSLSLKQKEVISKYQSYVNQGNYDDWFNNFISSN